MSLDREYLNSVLEEIDASMFLGDIFIDNDIREKLKRYMKRWEFIGAASQPARKGEKDQ